MKLQVGKTTSDKLVLDKNFTQVGEDLTCVLKENTDIVNPTFIINTPTSLDINYCFAEELGRWYYCKPTMLPGGRVALDCHVDVLKSNAAGIKALNCIIDKQEGDHSNKYLDDGSYVRLNKSVNSIIPFSGGFNNQGTFILICAGGN